MKQKNRSVTYLYIMAFAVIGLVVGIVAWYTISSADDISFTITDNSTGFSSVTSTIYGERTNIIHVDDRNNDDHCRGTIEFATHETVDTGTLKLEVYINSMDLLSDVDLGLVGDSGVLITWHNFTQYMNSEEWVTVEISYSLEYNKAELIVNGVTEVSMSYFASNPDSLNGFYIESRPTGTIDMYIDIIATH